MADSLQLNLLEQVIVMSGIHSDILKVLEAEDEVLIDDVVLVEAIRNGDPDAGYKLFVKHHRMVLKIVLSITNGRWFDDDCFNAGAVGMFEAVKRYDTTLGYAFLTYAVPWIKKYVYLEACNAVLPAGGISFSRDFKERMYRYVGFKMLGMSDDKIQARMNVSAAMLEEISLATRNTSRPSPLMLQLDELYGDNESSESVPVPGMPTVSSAEEIALELDDIKYFIKVIESIPDEVSKTLLRNILVDKIDETTAVGDERYALPSKNISEILKEVGATNKLDYFRLRKKAYRHLRKAMRESEREYE